MLSLTPLLLMVSAILSVDLFKQTNSVDPDWTALML